MTSNSLKIALAASLAVNLLLIGGGIAMMKCRHDAKHHMRAQAQILRMHGMKGIPGHQAPGMQDCACKKGKQRGPEMNREGHVKPGERLGVREDRRMKRMQDTPEARAFFDEMKADRTRLETALKKEPMNEAEVRQIMTEMQEKHNQMIAKRKEMMVKRNEKLLEEAKNLSPEERVRLFSDKDKREDGAHSKQRPENRSEKRPMKRPEMR